MSTRFIPETQPEERLVDGLSGEEQIAVAIHRLADSINKLGYGNVEHPGAVERISMMIEEGFSTLASSVSELADK